MLRRVALFCFIPIAAFAGPITYSVAVLSAPSGLSVDVYMTGINNSGQVAGQGFTSTHQQAFISSPSGNTLVPLPAGWTDAGADGINSSGQVVGTGDFGVVNQPFIGTTAGSMAIPFPSGVVPNVFGAYGYGVNDSGQVVGSVGGSPGAAFIGNTSGTSAVPLPSGWTGGVGQGINEAGQVTGWGDNGFITQAFIGSTSGGSAIPLPSGFLFTGGFALNDSGEVVGDGSTRSGGPEQAFIGTTSGSTAIPLPSGATDAFAGSQSINDSGMVVGNSDTGGWIWDATDGTILLNTLVPTGWNITDGISISNNGLILAEGTFDGGPSEYVELSAAPEPATWLFTASGLGLLAFTRRYRRR